MCDVIVCLGTVPGVTMDQTCPNARPSHGVCAFQIPGCRPCLAGGIIGPSVCQEDPHMMNRF